MRFRVPQMREAAAASAVRQGVLAAIFFALILVAVIAFVRAPYALIRTSLSERAGIARIVDAQDLLTAITSRQVAPRKAVRLAQRVARVLDSRDDRVPLARGDLAAVGREWGRAREHPRDEVALARLGDTVAGLVNKISDAAGLTYDSDVDVINFGDATTYQLPPALENVALATDLADRPPATLTIMDRISIARLMARAEVGWSGAENDFNLGRAATTLDLPLLAVRRDVAGHAFASLQTRLNAAAETPNLRNVAALNGAYRMYHSAAQTYLGVLDTTLVELLERRIVRARSRIEAAFLSGSIAFLVGLIFVARVSRSMLEREERALQIVQERARALETELARRRSERARVLNEAQFRTIFEGSPLGIATLDRAGSPLESNSALSALLADFSLFDESFEAESYGLLLAGKLPPPQIERRVVAADGSVRWIDLTVFPVRVSGDDDVAAIAMIADVTERKVRSERLLYEARHDALTGLRSRNAFLDDLRAAPISAAGPGRLCQAVILIDLDRFKLVNDTLGHAVGDEVLVTVAKRLGDVVGPDDILARLHGDEFALFVTTAQEAEITQIVRLAQTALRAPIIVGGQPVRIDSTAGICIARSDLRPETVLRNAGTAMFTAKRAGRGRFLYSDGSMQQASTQWTTLAADMMSSLERGEFSVVYQPIVLLGDASIHGFEALLRWHHRKLGPISPVTFIPIAEETGAIAQLGRFALAEACRQLSRWDWEDPKGRALTMSVNLSVHQLQDYIVADVERSLAQAGISGHRLNLEITESTFLESGPDVLRILSRLRETGARLSLDDFGTGYSSLRYLQQFPIDLLKIDRSFVAGSDGSLASEPIVRMLLNLADTLGLQAIAEGIETEEQGRQLRALGCRLGQGFYFSEPQTPGQIATERQPFAKAARRRRFELATGI